MKKQSTPTVVVGVSHDEPNRVALEWAAYLASARGATLKAISAHPVSPRLAAGLESIERVVKSAQRDTLAPIRIKHPELEITTDISWLLPAEALRQSASEADLVVVGARDSSFWTEVLGSTSRPVAAAAPCPVVVVPEDGTAPATAERQVVLALDDSAPSREAAEFAFAQAAAWGAPITAVHAASPDAATEDVFATTLDPLQEQNPDVPVTRSVVCDEIAPALADLAGEQDLVVVGSRGRGSLLSLLLGSVSRDVLGRAVGPVAVVTEGDLRPEFT